MDWSVIADGLKNTVNDYTYGLFGNGYMKRQPGETDEQYKERMARGLGAASAAFNSSIKPNMMDSFKWEVVKQNLLRAFPWVAVGAAGLFIFKKSKKSSKSKRR